MTHTIDAGASRAGIPLFGAGVLIAGAFWTLAWLAPRPGEPLFIGAIATAAEDTSRRSPCSGGNLPCRR